MDKYVNLKNLKPNYDAGISGGSSSKFDLNDSGSLSDCCSKNKKLKSNHGAAVAGPSTPSSSSSSHSMSKSTLFVVTETDSEAEAELQNVSLEVEVEDNGSMIFDKSGNEEDDTEDEVESVQPVVQKKKLNIHKHKFQEKWLQIYPWLRFDNNKLLCYPCNNHLGFKIYDIKRHDHKKNCSKLRNTPKITNVLESEAVLKKHQQVKRAELKICAFLHEHNLPFLLADHLPKFIRSICPDSDIAKNINCSRTKATYSTNECINLEQLEYLSNILKKNKFSLLIDETTDISTEKSLAMVIRFYNGYIKKLTFKDAQRKWTEIGTILNSMPGATRDWRVGERTKLKVSNKSKHVRGTGGGPPVEEELSELEEDIVDIVKVVSIKGHKETAESVVNFNYSDDHYFLENTDDDQENEVLMIEGPSAVNDGQVPGTSREPVTENRKAEPTSIEKPIPKKKKSSTLRHPIDAVNDFKVEDLENPEDDTLLREVKDIHLDLVDNSRISNRKCHVLIYNDTKKITLIKRTLCWLLDDKNPRLSADRLQRVRGPKCSTEVLMPMKAIAARKRKR
ncbi:unnamed protein product [Phaedon cochleariae]|uniref:Uncharacterized protein n=1 Tax=Phaedon cochleariae TaxID=80249 RepID=A0A9N9SHQ1_PHACE|nr:unnamed protein product [Phaedon cochleariae]